jgi:hypothetical protein
MRRTAIVALGLILLAGVGTVAESAAQAQTPSPQDESQPASEHGARRRVPSIPCWRQAGMTSQVVNERWKIEDRGKSRIAAVCADASLSPQQRHDKILQINVETDQEVAKLIPVKQLEAFNSCQAELDKNRRKIAGQKELGPCGGVIPPSTTDLSHIHKP